jgi:UDP-2,4-diacetamido-2,4,6-trideoxy-beta-L-altropyranose hydrolase
MTRFPNEVFEVHPCPSGGVTIRLASSGDARRVWQWRNDPETRAASFDARPVPYVDHETWFAVRLSDPATRFYIIVQPEESLVGYVRFALEGDNAVISIALDASVRGQGIGTAAIIAGCERVLEEPTVNRVTASVKADNEPSMRAFTKAGFGLSTGGKSERESERILEFPPT